MPIPRVYLTDPLDQPTITLSREISHHLLRVLRCHAGDTVILFDGHGRQTQAIIDQANAKKCVVSPQQLIDMTPAIKPTLHLAAAISRSHHMDFSIQKSVECGVSSITPIISKRVSVKLDTDRMQKKMLHWQKIIISACEQCGQNYLPALNQPCHLNQFVIDEKPGFFASCQADNSVMSSWSTDDKHTGTLLIGPEAGWSEEEEQTMHNAGWQGITLGPLILRTETAAIVGLTLLRQSHSHSGHGDE